MNQQREPTIAVKFRAKREAWARQPAILNTIHRVFEGDARTMRELGVGELVHLVVTSPPYWNLKEYPQSPGINSAMSATTIVFSANCAWSGSGPTSSWCREVVCAS